VFVRGRAGICFNDERREVIKMSNDSVMSISEEEKDRKIRNSSDARTKGSLILSKSWHKHIGVYRGILELLARFGYVSVREVMYGFQLSLTSALHRLSYLEKINLIHWFPSHTVPVTFYCLTNKGRQAIQRFNISDDLFHFTPSRYQFATQEHHRSTIRVYLALRKFLGDRFLGWTTEQRLKAEGGTNREKRILDGELFLNVQKTRYKAQGEGEMAQVGEPTLEKWRCGIEVELSLKSPERYRKQFRDLAGQVYSLFDKQQLYPMVVFFYSSPTLHDRLAGHLRSGQYDFGNCVFYLIQIDEFLEKLGGTVIERIICSSSFHISSLEMGEIKVVVR
jgi:hypothetical protein